MPRVAFAGRDEGHKNKDFISPSPSSKVSSFFPRFILIQVVSHTLFWEMQCRVSCRKALLSRSCYLREKREAYLQFPGESWGEPTGVGKTEPLEGVASIGRGCGGEMISAPGKHSSLVERDRSLHLTAPSMPISN